MREIIDFHTHIFPEKIADAAIGKLSSIIHLAPAINGKEEGLLSSMEQADIAVSVVHPVVTNPRQFDSIIRFASYINETYQDQKEGRILSFAGIHPQSDQMKEQMALIKREGFKGIKIHPNYQETEFSDLKIKRLLYRAAELEIPVLTHAGFDPYTPDQQYCSPEMIAEVVSEVKPYKLIAAHMGSNCFYEESYEQLCGLDLYFDTAYSIANMSQDQFVKMVKRHGADKVLFASDCPWADQRVCVAALEESDLTDQEKQMIRYENAKNLLEL